MKTLILATLLIASPPVAASAQPSTSVRDPAARHEAQRDAMAALAFLDGQWRGEGRMGAESFTQTERAGPLLDGAIKLIEGRAYDENGETVFNALAVISYDPARRSYVMRAYAMSYAGEFPLTVRPDGYSWTQSTGPGVSIRYTATITGDSWIEIGERIAGDAPPVKIFEMRLERIDDGAWPAADAVLPAR